MERGRDGRRALMVALVGTALLAAPGAEAVDRVLRTEIEIAATLEEVWKAWTTPEGIATFFAPVGKVDLRVDGTYDVWFNPTGEPGERGAEGMRILDVYPTLPPVAPTLKVSLVEGAAPESAR